MDKGAGIDFLATVGTDIKAGEPLYQIVGNVEADLRRALSAADEQSGIEIE